MTENGINKAFVAVYRRLKALLPGLATELTPGLMSAADKGKLDAVPGGKMEMDESTWTGYVRIQNTGDPKYVYAPIELDIDNEWVFSYARKDHTHDGYAAATHTHAASSITSGTFATSLIPSLAASKITSGTFATSLIPSLAASKITSGTFATARIPSLDASKITSGTFATARIPDLSSKYAKAPATISVPAEALETEIVHSTDCAIGEIGDSDHPLNDIQTAAVGDTVYFTGMGGWSERVVSVETADNKTFSTKTITLQNGEQRRRLFFKAGIFSMTILPAYSIEGHTHEVATASTNGFMSADDVQRLDKLLTKPKYYDEIDANGDTLDSLIIGWNMDYSYPEVGTLIKNVGVPLFGDAAPGSADVIWLGHCDAYDFIEANWIAVVRYDGITYDTHPIYTDHLSSGWKDAKENGINPAGGIDFDAIINTTCPKWHTHKLKHIEGLQSALNNKASYSHSHSATQITSGKLAIARLPTGTTSTTVALGNHTHTAATTAAPGYMSAADKAKLDALPTFWFGTQAEYDALATKDATTIYYITE